jgi:hypothetical protein
MTAAETYEKMIRLGLAANLTEDFDLRVFPKKRLTPALRDAIKEHKAEIVCRVMQESFLVQAAEHYGLELDPKKMPPESPEVAYAMDDQDPDALLEALYEYVHVWRRWHELEEVLDSPSGGVSLDDIGLLVVAPDPA